MDGKPSLTNHLKTKLMKKYNFICGLLILTILVGCKEETLVAWQSPALEQYNVTAIPGGATIDYVIPNDRDIMYIMAEYERNGKIFTEKSSVFKNELTIEGFNTTQLVKATLYKVNKLEQKSSPLHIEFTPLESPISMAYKSLDLVTAFGGINVFWENITQTTLGVRLMIKKEGKLETDQVYYSQLASELHAFRGFADTLTVFAISLEDKWSNISDTIYYETTPYYETEMEKPFVDIRALIPYDNTRDLYGARYDLSKMWNGIIGPGNDGYISEAGNYGTSFTFDLKKVTKLSRMIMWPRMVAGQQHTFASHNPLEFEMWGIKKLDTQKLTNLPYWLDDFSAPAGTVIPEHTFKDDWTYIGKYAPERIDLQGASQAEIIQRGLDGHHFDIPIDVDAVRYIRIFIRRTAFGSPPYQLMVGEWSFFGDDTVPQE